MAVFTFFIFGWKRPFCANLVKNVKRVSLSLNLVASLIRICRVQWCCSLFRFRPEIPFLVRFGPNCQYCQLKVKRWNLIPRLIRICRIQWWCFFFFTFGRKYLFWANLVEIVSIVSLRWNLIPRLVRICRIQWRCSFFLLSIGKALFGQIWSKMLKLSV